jgi:Ser-tRNA(Ala) deacylase AlaX
VLKLAREGEEILHFLEGPLPEAASEITGKIDRTKGHQLMRTHAAMHVL